MKKREPETPVRRIAVTLSASRCNSLVMEGLIRFSRSRPNWLLHMEELSVPNSRMDGLDAMVGTFPDRESVAAHSRLSALMLSVFRKPPDARIPAILVDHEAVGRMAARYFIDKGITTLAYIGRSRTGFDPRRDPHLDRYVGFQREAGTHRVIPAPEYNPWQPDSVRMIKRWLHALPHPVGLFCVGDAVAHWVSDICRMEGIPVPDHIAILGVNNDIHLCELTDPTLSSIVIPWEGVGEEIGRQLDILLESGIRKPRTVWIKPLSVMERGSTLGRDLDYELFVKTQTLLRESAHSVTNLKEILLRLPASRRRVERSFLKYTGNTLLHGLWMQRVEQAQIPLQSTPWPLAKIAESCGFSCCRQMNRIFERMVGAYPRRMRLRAASPVQAKR